MTSRQSISDSTPLIALARIEELDLVRRTLGEVLIPDAVYDEIKVAKRLGVEVQGCLGILQRAKRRGLISDIRPLTTRLQSKGWRISERELEEFLSRSGE